jgi:hypothetical protein
VTRLVVLTSLRYSVLGIVAGVACAVGEGRLLTAFLFGVTPWDPMALSTVVILLSFTAWSPRGFLHDPPRASILSLRSGRNSRDGISVNETGGFNVTIQRSAQQCAHPKAEKRSIRCAKLVVSSKPGEQRIAARKDCFRRSAAVRAR